MCRAAVNNAQAAVAEKAQVLESNISPSTGFVFGDPRRLRESIEHVLQNAIAYTDQKGKISVRAEGDAKRAIVEIRDNGPGIAEEDQPRVFNRFDRVVDAGVRGQAALGLGLPLTRQFVEAHGGTVELSSSKGKGTTVTLTIPRGQK
jgi:signal transduction histidine kinase